MSLLGKLFGSRTAVSERARADALFAEGSFGAAKLAYERAFDLAKGTDDAARPVLVTRIDACRDALARQRIVQADALLAQGQDAIAVEELRSAIDTAADAALVHDAQDRIERLERAAARQHVQQQQRGEPAAEDRFEMLAGGFEEDQYAEYRAHGERIETALLALHDGKIEKARAILEDELPKTDAPRYLWFELGRARLATGEIEAGAAALTTFLSTLHADEGGDARLLAHIELAQVEQSKGDTNAAVQQYEAALDAMPDDPRPYLALSAFLRREGAPEEAAEVAQAGLDALAEAQSPWQLWQALGLAQADAGHDDRAVEQLERVIDFLVAQRHVEPPPEGTLRLAQLYERKGKPARALDLYSLLARGSDTANLCDYHVHAARLMNALGLDRDARSMLQRAIELAGDDVELAASLKARLPPLERGPRSPEDR